ncbi:MAG: AAA family ATPase [bacterium]
MNSGNDDSPMEDLQDFFQEFQDKYQDNVHVEHDFVGEEPEDIYEEPEDWDFDFNYTPGDVKQHLDEYVIGQNQAKKHISNAVCYHYRQIDRSEPFYKKKNILMVGSTGVGKTHLVEVVSDLIGVPFVKADATKFSGTGYVGKNVNSLIRELLEKADGNVAKAEHGIVFIDEIDKICSSDEDSRDVTGRDVQTNLLKLLEETEIDPVDSTDPMSMIKGMQGMMGGAEQDQKINTGNIMFIASGAFPGLEDLIEERLDRAGIGFNAELANERNLEILPHCSVDDLMDYGLEAEFVGRFPVRTYFHDLNEDHMYQILTESKSSILNSYRADFEAYDMEIEFTDEALRTISERAVEHDIGARGLTTELEDLLFEFMHHLPEQDVDTLTIDKSTVEAPTHALYSSIIENELDDRLQELSSDGVPVTVNEEGREALLEHAVQEQRSPMELFEDRFAPLDYILRMVEFDEVEIDRSFVESPEEKLEEICSEHYSQHEE